MNTLLRQIQLLSQYPLASFPPSFQQIGWASVHRRMLQPVQVDPIGWTGLLWWAETHPGSASALKLSRSEAVCPLSAEAV